MLNSSVTIRLISVTLTKDSNGAGIPSETFREVFAEVTSVSGSEWAEGGRVGVNPELRFIVFEPDYNREECIEYNGQRYRIYRTYTDGDWIELYTEKRNGAPIGSDPNE